MPHPHGQGDDVTSEVHPQLKIATKVKTEVQPHELDHARDKFPYLIGDDWLPVLILTINHLLTPQVDGNVGHFLLWELDVEALLDGTSDALGDIVTSL